MLVGAQVVNPQLPGPRYFAGGFALEENHIGLDSLRIEQAGGQPQQRVHIARMQELLANRLTRAAFKQHVVG